MVPIFGGAGSGSSGTITGASSSSSTSSSVRAGIHGNFGPPASSASFDGRSGTLSTPSFGYIQSAIAGGACRGAG